MCKKKVMYLSEFLQLLLLDSPPESLSEELKALWWDKKGDWDRAHSIAQEIVTAQGSAIHAYLHRKEGVLWNADYWYAKAGRQRQDISLDMEWEQLAAEMVIRAATP